VLRGALLSSIFVKTRYLSNDSKGIRRVNSVVNLMLGVWLYLAIGDGVNFGFLVLYYVIVAKRNSARAVAVDVELSLFDAGSGFILKT